ncbi:MAG: exodeoxyribonuclease V subunit alpha [Polyangiales bacterium]
MSLDVLRSNDEIELLDIELARALVRMSSSDRAELELAIALTSRNVRNGHTCLPLDVDPETLGLSSDRGVVVLPDSDRWCDVIRESKLTAHGPLMLDNSSRLYLRRYYDFERDVAEELAARASLPTKAGPDMSSALDRLFGHSDHPAPRQAATQSLLHRVSVLCGGPGTGKTTTIAAIVALLVERHFHGNATPPRIALLAPTGKAAVRLGEAVIQAKQNLSATANVIDAIPSEATTLHRALGMRRHGMKFRHGPDLPLEADIIVVDEASMVDLGLMRQLLVSAAREATLLIVGDPDQLTSVEAGSVLRDLVRASDETWWRGRVTRLTKTYRYDATAMLGRLVSAIRDGDAAEVAALLDSDDESIGSTGHDALDGAIARAARRWENILRASDAEEHFRRRGGFVVLSPFRKGQLGTNRLGEVIVRRLGREGSGVRPIIIEENQHDLGVYNGDLGMAFERNGLEMATVQREAGNLQELAAVRLPRHTQAFALSVHKAQGSEFDDVLIVLPEEDSPQLTRELIYTAVSRARQGVQLVGPKRVISAALARRAQRFSGLVDRVAELAP